MTQGTQRVLVVDDEADLRELLVITLGRMKLEAEAVGTLEDAFRVMSESSFDLCLTDMNLPDGNGIDLVRHASRRYPDMPIAMITAHGSMETATQAMKEGAFDFIAKPVTLDRLRQLIDDGLDIRRQGPAEESVEQLIGDHPIMQALREQIGKLSRSQAPIYIAGESGSGKERVARLIHGVGSRREKPFVAVNCGAIPSELMESEFFGHRKGSFTGAYEDRKGLFREADGGTLFLDEVADLPLHMQVKLLRAIQEKSVRPIGESREFPVNVRLLSATHKSLAREVAEDRFRQDLYYRLNVIETRVPSLRERACDIPALANHILGRLCQLWNLPLPQITDDAWQALKNYPFPGNVRELENILERALTLSDGQQIGSSHLQLPEADINEIGQPGGALPSRPAGMPLEDFLQEVERTELLRALEATHWNRTAAAKKLGMTFRSLRYRLQKLSLDQGGDDEEDETE
ncbi:sigma-54 dependent transcriptional regulator [Alcanivorax sp. 1008]|uniref:sigma-54-dependent transcriptional regulator n=1 Tax=Alcanivorax sp. 1008 TaxID=2816853 RepID=UPI001D30F39F|nr:sigma-54 dependent transcriptional regulator [Alcanivorax sp. 1008]MCC1496550.1 sigma-54-dependent Fis family transcriptional regulator [Alcanivorax sp. 1008]